MLSEEVADKGTNLRGPHISLRTAGGGSSGGGRGRTASGLLLLLLLELLSGEGGTCATSGTRWPLGASRGSSGGGRSHVAARVDGADQFDNHRPAALPKLRLELVVLREAGREGLNVLFCRALLQAPLAVIAEGLGAVVVRRLRLVPLRALLLAPLEARDGVILLAVRADNAVVVSIVMIVGIVIAIRGSAAISGRGRRIVVGDGVHQNGDAAENAVDARKERRLAAGDQRVDVSPADAAILAADKLGEDDLTKRRRRNFNAGHARDPHAVDIKSVLAEHRDEVRLRQTRVATEGHRLDNLSDGDDLRRADEIGDVVLPALAAGPEDELLANLGAHVEEGVLGEIGVCCRAETNRGGGGRASLGEGRRDG